MRSSYALRAAAADETWLISGEGATTPLLGWGGSRGAAEI